MLTFWIFAAALQAVPAPVVPPAPVANWRVAAVTAGAWSYRPVAGGSEAVFQDYSGPQLTLRCNLATRQVALIRTGAQPGVPLAILTTSTEASLPPGNVLPAMSPALDAIAFSRGRFAVRSGSAPLLILPAWPEAARSIEDCRK